MMAGFLKWFSSRTLTRSGQTAPLEISTSEESGDPSLMAVINRTTSPLPFAQSGVHPPIVRAPSARTAQTLTAFMAFLHD